MNIRIIFLFYSILVFLISPFYIIKHIKKVKSLTGRIIAILGGTSIFLSTIFSLGIVIYQAEIWLWGFIICFIISVLCILITVLRGLLVRPEGRNV